eukprot:TRINITY_DN5173_c0_g1_i1.p1 TRINITY_DN5173_c0_g1~~TRINITY_DN5173_c0_g1_i1.p1  ORF type:complete len:147 (-),score=10.12 TRINITY_DN5173_c0_g1_i1:216-656(-)
MSFGGGAGGGVADNERERGPGGPSLSGYLSKRGDKGIKTWKRRFFVLEYNEIAYYVDETRQNELGRIPLKGSTVPTSFTVGSQGEGYFQINTPLRIYYLVADTKSTMDKWTKACQKSIEMYHHRKNSLPPRTLLFSSSKASFSISR